MNCCRGRFEDKSWLLQALVTLVGSVDTAQVNIGLSCLPNQSDTYVTIYICQQLGEKDMEHLHDYAVLGQPLIDYLFPPACQ